MFNLLFQWVPSGTEPWCPQWELAYVPTLLLAFLPSHFLTMPPGFPNNPFPPHPQGLLLGDLKLRQNIIDNPHTYLSNFATIHLGIYFDYAVHRDASLSYLHTCDQIYLHLY